jgi:hypothetical protein
MTDLTHLFTKTTPAHLQKAADFIQGTNNLIPGGNNLILSMPPRSGKTSLVVAYAKSLIDQGKKALYITYSKDLGKMVCNGCECEVIGLDDLSRLGGKDYDAILVDDILKGRQEAHNENHVKMAVTWFDSVFMSSARKPETKTIIIGSRWQEHDFMGYYRSVALSSEYAPFWGVFEVPAIGRGMTGSECSYWPKQYPLEDLDEIRKSISSNDFKWLYQQGGAE